MTDRAAGPRRRHLVGSALFGCSLLVLLSGIAVTAFGQWRQGSQLSALGLLFASAVRLVLPDTMAGMLRVRRKWVDVVALTALGAGLLVVAIVVPETR